MLLNGILFPVDAGIQLADLQHIVGTVAYVFRKVADPIKKLHKNHLWHHCHKNTCYIMPQTPAFCNPGPSLIMPMRNRAKHMQKKGGRQWAGPQREASF